MKSIRENEEFHLTVPAGNGCRVESASKEKMLTVHEACEKMGISQKTLYYYDKIGLLKPISRRGKQHSKMYGPDALERLRKILSYQNAVLTSGIHFLKPVTMVP